MLVYFMGFKKTLASIVLAGALAFCGGKEAKATLINSNSIVKDNIEYYMQTDKSVYNLGEPIEMVYRWKNPNDQPALFKFFRMTPCDFSIEQDSQRIWLGKGFYDYTNGGPVYTLNPLEFKEYNETCPGLNIKGDFQVKGELIGHEYNGTIVGGTTLFVPINIIPEPSTLVLLALGVGMLARRKD